MVISKNWNSGNISPRKSGILELLAAANQEVNNSRIPDLRELIIPEFQISGIIPDWKIWNFGILEIWNSGNLESGILEFWKSGILVELVRLRKSGILEIWNSGGVSLRKSGILEIWNSGRVSLR